MSERPTKHQKRIQNIFIDDQAVHSNKESEEEGEWLHLITLEHIQLQIVQTL